MAADIVYVRLHAAVALARSHILFAMIYAVALSIKHDATYEERLESAVGVVRREALGVWEEFTSFIVIETSKTTDELAQAIYLDSEFDGEKDGLVVVSLSYQHYVARGVIENPSMLAHVMSRR